MFRYRLYEADGTEAGEATYSLMIKPGEIVWASDKRKLLVIDVVPTEEEDSPYVGMLMVEAA